MRNALLFALAFLAAPVFAAAQPPFGMERRPSLRPLPFPRKDPPARYRLERVFSSLSFQQPVFLTAAHDGSRRIFVVERIGRVHVVKGGVESSRAETFLNIENEVGTESWEEGLLGLAFDPDYARNGAFYVLFSTPAPRRIVIRRYRASDGNPDRADPRSAQDVLTIPMGDPIHFGGMIAFGPDRMLYASIGDGTDTDKEWRVVPNGQDLHGAILRIDPRQPAGKPVPPDNPFVGNRWGIREEIWAYGLRNTWRFSFVPSSDVIIGGDVGNHRREEINLIRKGRNYGWPFREGDLPFAIPPDPEGVAPPLKPLGVHPFKDPILAYDHDVGLCVIGGYVYRGRAAPSLRGKYVYGDFSVLPRTAPLWAMRLDLGNDRATGNEEIARFPKLVSFGEDEQGELYAISLGGAGIARLVEEASVTEERREPPRRLSQTGLFTRLAPLEAAPGLIAYDINRPFWSDGAEKARWIAVPDGQRITFHRTQAFTLPVGTKLIKHFALRSPDGREHPVETRVLSHQEDGWRGFTYEWNRDGTEAFLLPGAKRADLPAEWFPPGEAPRARWYFPSRSDCFSCHTAEAGTVLGIRAPQLQRSREFPGGIVADQLGTWNHIGLFRDRLDERTLRASPALHPPFTAPSLSEEVREYVDVNCAPCHRPGVLTQTGMDLRHETPWPAKHVIGVAPKLGDLGIPGARLVLPGDPERSLLLQRMMRHDANRMPPLGSLVTDRSVAEAIREWIRTMDAAPGKRHPSHDTGTTAQGL